MRPSTKGIISIAMALSFMLPAVTLAAGLTDVQINSIIGMLQSFGVDSHTISTVQNVLNGMPSSSAPGQQSQWAQGTSSEAEMQPPEHTPPGQMMKASCITLSRNLSIGSEGSDVRELQQALSEDPESGFTASSTGYFGPMTARALARFQEHNGIASTTTGFAGPLTRGFFEHRCGTGLLGNGQQGNGAPAMMVNASTSAGQEGEQSSQGHQGGR